MKFYLKAILWGLAVDIVLSTVLGGLLLITTFGPQSTPDAFNTDTGALLFSLIFGLLCTTIGGYITSYKSPSSKLANVLFNSALGVLLGLIIEIFYTFPLWFTLVGSLLVIPFNILGWYLEKNIHFSGIKNNKGKTIILLIYIISIFCFPLGLLSPSSTTNLVKVVKSFGSPEADTLFRHYIYLLKEKKIQEAYSMVSPEVQKEYSLSSVDELAAYFASTTNQIYIAGIYINVSKGDLQRTDYDITYEIQNNDPKYKYILTQIIARDEGSGIKILTIFVSPQENSVKESGKFDLSRQWWLLLLSIIIPLFVAYTAFRYLIKTKQPKWWLFLIILLLSLYVSFGNGGFSINVGTYGFMHKAGLWGPWVFMTPIPLGAIYYYFVRKKLEDQEMGIAEMEMGNGDKSN